MNDIKTLLQKANTASGFASFFLGLSVGANLIAFVLMMVPALMPQQAEAVIRVLAANVVLFACGYCAKSYQAKYVNKALAATADSLGAIIAAAEANHGPDQPNFAG